MLSSVSNQQPESAASVKTKSINITPKIGSIITFGNYNWRILNVQNDKALILTEEIIEKRPYNKKFKNVTWEECTLRKYLNGGFLDKFTKEQQGRIINIQVINRNNPWFGTKDGSDTTDEIFLLSLEEVKKYFGDSGQLMNKNQKNEFWIDDQYNSKRRAKYGNETDWWWLRSLGIAGHLAAGVGSGGRVSVSGDGISNDGGVRPALWLNL